MFLSGSPIAHDLSREVQHILRFIAQRERVNFPPLHLPSVKMVEIKARAWSQTVFNFRSFLRSWVPGQPQECACRTWCSSETGHLFAHVRQILPTSPLADLNLNDTNFSVRQAMDTYCRQGITHVVQQVEATGSCTFKTLALDAAAAYLASRCLQSDRHELHREVKHDLQVMQGLVFTPVDHFPHSLHVACPFCFS